jgi:replicative DNA helicase
MSSREAPNNVEAEKTVLGCTMLRPSVYVEVSSVLRVDDFFLPAHWEIFDAMGAVTARQRPCDPLMVGDELKVRGMLPRLPGGEGYLMDLVGGVTHAENVAHHVSLVSEAAVLRRLGLLCAETLSRTYGSQRAGEIVADLGANLAKLVIQSPGELCHAGALVGELLEDFERRMAAGPDENITGVRTGIEMLDRLTCGFDPGDLVVIGADPGGGKTALAEQVAIVSSIHGGGSALVCNLEMRKTQLVERALVYLARKNSLSVRQGAISNDDFRDLHDAGMSVEAGRLYVEDKLFTLPQIIARARAWRVRHPKELGLLVVDFIQLLRSVGGDEENRARQLGIWTQALKELAKTLEIVVIAVSQLNRGPHKDKRPPGMRDLRESGDIEGAADTIILIHNPDKTEDGPVDLLIEKNRKGPCKRVRGHWLGRYYQFTDCDDPQPQPERQVRLPGAD